jgi:uncharacterized membrane protein YqiK
MSIATINEFIATHITFGSTFQTNNIDLSTRYSQYNNSGRNKLYATLRNVESVSNNTKTFFGFKLNQITPVVTPVVNEMTAYQRAKLEIESIKAENERIAREREAENERIKAENERIKAEREAENERIAREREAENERIKAENERIAREREAENERIKAENERIKAENERIKAEREAEIALKKINTKILLKEMDIEQIEKQRIWMSEENNKNRVMYKLKREIDDIKLICV